MKKDIHPTYFTEAKVVCSCGHVFVTGSTKQEIHVEVCFKCHPLYTGEKRFVDTLGQVGKFQEKQKTAATLQEKYPGRKDKSGFRGDYKPKTLKELLQEV